jgi:hypothetical protein
MGPSDVPGSTPRKLSILDAICSGAFARERNPILCALELSQIVISTEYDLGEPGRGSRGMK